MQSMSPIIATRANSILEMMETVWIPHNNLPLSYPRYEFSCIMAVTTNPQVLEYPNGTFRRGANNSECNCQSLTMTSEYMLLLIILNIRYMLSLRFLLYIVGMSKFVNTTVTWIILTFHSNSRGNKTLVTWISSSCVFEVHKWYCFRWL